MPAPQTHIETKPTLPGVADIVVVGGGIVGSFATYFSAAALEKGRIGIEQSSGNWGWCRQQNRDPSEPMATKSLDLWERVASRRRS